MNAVRRDDSPFDSHPALLIDYGGVRTASIYEGFGKACVELGVDPEGFIAECFSPDSTTPFALLELGAIGHEEFREKPGPVLSRFAT